MGNVIEINESVFTKEVLESENAVLVDFWAPWCGPCRMMAPILESIVPKVSPIKVLKVNTDENQALAAQYDIQGIPCLIVFKDGKEVERLVGFTAETMLLSKLETYKK